jgi:hypothetical protein
LAWALACSAWFWMRFWLAIAVATAWRSFTSSSCMSATDWSRILLGSSALLSTALALARTKRNRRSKKPMDSMQALALTLASFWVPIPDRIPNPWQRGRSAASQL